MPSPAARSPATFCLLALTLTWPALGCGTPGPKPVVLYCALDREFAEQVLADFTARTGVDVLPQFDTEANKSVGLYQSLVREAEHPRCDVHWNNEILGTIRLQRRGLLQPYASPSARPYPESCRAGDDTWHAFAARARVLLVNTDLLPPAARPRSLRDLTRPALAGQVAMAKPQFGTTATQAACLFAAWGRDRAEGFYRDLAANGVRLVAGNKQVAEGVGRGDFAAGLTDTDDAVAEARAGRPVEIIFPDQPGPGGAGGGTLFLPNTVALIRGCPNPEGGRQLIDFLLSPEVELALARSAGCQIPLNPAVHAELPAALAGARDAVPLRVDFAAAAGEWDRAQVFLTDLFAR